MFSAVLRCVLGVGILGVGCVTAALAEPAAPTQAEPEAPPLVEAEADRWLLKMLAAIQQKPLSGLMTYEYGGPLETVLLSPQRLDGQEQETLRHLSGSPRSYRRIFSALSCQSGPQNLPAWRAFYQVQWQGQRRVADKNVLLLKLIPLDDARLGMTFGVDPETAFPHLMTLQSATGQILERFQLVQRLPEKSPIPDARPVLDSPHLSWKTLSPSRICKPPIQASLADNQGWQVRWLPAGFHLKHSKMQGEGLFMVFSDGLATFSLVIRPLMQVSPAVGVLQRGATVAALTLAARDHTSFKVAVVGEIPLPTAQRIAASVAYVAP
jgi:sigma-E factor negative regulatory protein RseB